MEIVMRVMGHQPRQQVTAWSMEQFDLIQAGRRGPVVVDDLSMSAWYRTCPAAGVSADTAHRVASGELSEIGKLTGKDGKRRPAKYKQRKAKPVAGLAADSSSTERRQSR